jgi:hypothetical protein
LRKLLETKENFGGFYHGFIVCVDSSKANGGTQNLKTSIIHMTLACFCYMSRSNRKTWPLYWLATNNTRRNTKRKRFERKSKTNTQRKTKHREIDCRENLDQMGLQ